MSSELVSIVVPVYNVSEYLGQCVDSLLCQSYENIEIILVDDGSTDASGCLCDEYGQKDARVKVVHKPNGGLSDARNKGIRAARGRYMMFVDSDDYVDQDYVGTMLGEIEGRQADVVQCGYHIVEDGRPTESRCCSLDADLPVKDAVGYLARDDEVKNYVWNKIYKRELFDKVEFPVGRLFEDICTTYRIFLQCHKISVIKKTLYYYRVRGGSIMRSIDFAAALDWLRARREQYGILAQLYPECRGDMLVHLINICCIAYALEVRGKGKAGDMARNQELKEAISFTRYEQKGCRTALPAKRSITFFLICYLPKAADCIFRSKELCRRKLIKLSRMLL